MKPQTEKITTILANNSLESTIKSLKENFIITPSLSKNRILKEQIIKKFFGFELIPKNFNLVISNNLEFNIQNLFIIDFNIDNSRKIIDTNLEDFKKIIYHYKSSPIPKYSKNRFSNIIYKYGMDLKFPDIDFLNMNNDEINSFFEIKKFKEALKIEKLTNKDIIINEVPMKEFISLLFKYTCNSIKKGTNNRFVNIIYKYGMNLKFPDIDFLNMNNDEVKSFFFDKLESQTCKFCKEEFKDIKEREFCKNKKCLYTFRSEKMKGDNNPRAKVPEKFGLEYRKLLSERTKNNINKGRFTPCVTNSWAKSKVTINNIPFRSTWEGYFYIFSKIKNKLDLEFEKLRIPYYSSEKQKERIYIVDFINRKNKVVYEIKPDSEKEDITVIEKENALKKWVSENDYNYYMINNSWFEENYSEIFLGEIEDDNIRNKIRNNLKQFIKRFL